MIFVDCPKQLKEKVGTTAECPMERSIGKAMLEAFTAISMDQSPIHQVDTSSAVVPGNLLITLLPAMLQSGLQVETFDHCKTVALNKVRFYQTVSLDELLRLSFQVIRVQTRSSNTFAVCELTLNRVEDGQKILTAVQTDCYVT